MAAAAAAKVAATADEPAVDAVKKLAAFFQTTLAALHEAVRCGDADRARLLLSELVQELTELGSEDVGNELGAAGGVGAARAAVEAFGRGRPAVLFYGCFVLRFLSFAGKRPPDHEAASVAALRVALHAPAAVDEAGQRFQTLGLVNAVVSAKAAATDAALRAEVLASGAIERLVSATVQKKTVEGLNALFRLFGERGLTLDACARRVITAGAVDAAVAALEQTRGKSGRTDGKLAALAAHLLSVMHDGAQGASSADEALLLPFRGRQAEIVDALHAGLAGPARANSDWIASILGAVCSFAKSSVGLCRPEQAVAVTDGILDLMRFVLTENDADLACMCGAAVLAFSGDCGGADTAAPGTYALRAGALPLVEAAIEAAKRSGSVTCTESIDVITAFARVLRGLDAAAAPLNAELEARLQRATEANNMAELVAVARDGIQRCDGTLIMRALSPMMDAFSADMVVARRCSAEAVAAGGVSVMVNAVKACGATDPLVLEAGCVLLTCFADMRPPPPRIVASSVAALRVALEAEPSTDALLASSQLNAMARVLCAARVAGDAALRAKALDAGAVERIVEGIRRLLASPSWCGTGICNLLLALFELCGPAPVNPDACTLRVITAGGVDAAVAATRLWDSESGVHDHIGLVGAQLFLRLHCVVRAAATPSEALVSAFHDEVAVLTVILDGLPGLVIETAANLGGWLSNFAVTMKGDRCSPSLAAKVTEAVVGILRRVLAVCTVPLEDVSSCVNTLKAFAGGCSVDDAAAPGTHALRLGALSLLEQMLPATNAELAQRGIDKATRKKCNVITDFVSKLRALEARREAAAAALVAEEEAENARRSKAAKSGKAAAAKAKPKKGSGAAAATKKPEPEADLAAAAMGAMAIADAGAAAGGPPPAEAVPAAPYAAPLQPAQAAPPPLPPWLTQAMQQPPSPTAAVPPPAAQSRAAQAQRLPNTAAASTQRRPAAASAPLPPSAGLAAGDTVPRELECAICLDAVAEGRTSCCGQTAFCAACAATLTGECPLCRAPPRAA